MEPGPRPAGFDLELAPHRLDEPARDLRGDEEDVVGLQVAVNDARRVGLGERVEKRQPRLAGSVLLDALATQDTQRRAPRGAGEDTLAKIAFQAPEWPLGKPDLVIDLPVVDVPATGVLPYQKPVIDTGMTEGRWMKASAFQVTDRRVLHHVTTGLRAPNDDGVDVTLTEARAGIGGQGPGRTINLTPPDMGIWIPAASKIAFETHYTPYGKATTEKTRMGLYFYPKGQEPKYPMRVHGLYDMGITIPAGAEWHPEIAYEDIPKDMLLYGLTPHAHSRGASTQVSIVFPDGREQVILAVPKYQFDWQ